MFKHHNLQMFGLTLEIVGRGSEKQLQVSANLHNIAWHVKGEKATKIVGSRYAVE